MFPYVPVIDEYLYFNGEQDSIGHVILFLKGDEMTNEKTLCKRCYA